MTYAGRVYDGPWEGRRLDHDRPWYDFNWVDPERVADFVPTRYASIGTTFQRFQYRWSQPLRAWVFVWPSRR